MSPRSAMLIQRYRVDAVDIASGDAAEVIEPGAEVADAFRQLLGLVDDDLVHIGVEGGNVGNVGGNCSCEFLRREFVVAR